MHFPELNTKLLAIKAHFFLAYGGVYAITPFIGTMAKERGYSGLLVGIVFFVMAASAVLARPVFGAITDRHRNQKTVLLYTIAVTAVATAFYPVLPNAPTDVDNGDDVTALRTHQFWLFFVFLFVRNVSINGLVTLTETICLQNLGKDSHKYGEQILWGTFGWGTATAMTGWLVDWYSYGKQTKDYTAALVLWTLLLMADLLVCALRLQDCQSEVVSKHILKDAKKLLCDIKVVGFFIWVAMFGGVLASSILYLPWHTDVLVTKYHPERQSSIKTIQGVMVFVNAIGSDAPVFYISGKIIKKIGHLNSMAFGLVALSARYFLYYIIKDPLWVIPVELLAGWGIALPGSALTAYGASMAPDGLKGTVQGLIGSIHQGVGTSLGSIVTGYLFGKIGSSETFLVLAMFLLAVCFTQIVITNVVWKTTKSKTEENAEHVGTVLPNVKTTS